MLPEKKYIRVTAMKRMITWAAAALVAAVTILPCRVDALSAKHAILVDACTGRVLMEKDADSRALIASTTKIMTALVVCEQCNVLDRMSIPKEAVGIEGSSMYLREGEVLTIQDLLYGLMLRSGNDAATALAIYCGGTVEGFAQLMNDKAHKLGMSSSHFENPHGLDSPNHYSTAHDLAVLASYAMRNPIFAQTVSAKIVTAGQRRLQNHNKLLWRLDGADGVKTGYTRAAGRILVSSATRDGRRLIAVTINAPDDWNDHISMLNRGFERYENRLLIKAGDRVGVRNVVGGISNAVDLIAAEDFVYSLAKDEEISYGIGACEFEYAPVNAGDEAGYLYICIQGKPVGKVRLLYAATVEQCQNEKLPFWKRWIGGS